MNHLIVHLPPIHFISDQRSHFINDIIEISTTKFNIIHHKSTIYYPQENGQFESTKKLVKWMLTNTTTHLWVLWLTLTTTY